MLYEFERDLTGLLPPCYRAIGEYQALCRTEEEALAQGAEDALQVARNFHPRTMDTAAAAQWEAILNILPNPRTEGLDFRRSRVVNRLSTRPPFTMAFLGQKLDELIGPGRWTAEVDSAANTLYVESLAQDQNYALEVSATIGRIKPAHVVYVSRPVVPARLIAGERVERTERTYYTKLGRWRLGEVPFAVESSPEVIKTEQTPSIQSLLLEQAAADLAGLVAAAKVNEETVIREVEKSVSGNQVTVTYTVAGHQTQVIQSLALLDGEGRELTRSAVYIPVTDEVVIKHTISVEEGGV